MSINLNALNLGALGTNVAASTALNCTALLTAGVYSVWALAQTMYVSTIAPPSTGLTTSTGFPVKTTDGVCLVNVPQNGQISFISSSSGSLSYLRVN